MILTIISLCLAVGGMLLMSRGGVPESVSGLVYSLSERMRWAWSGWLIAVVPIVVLTKFKAVQVVAHTLIDNRNVTVGYLSAYRGGFVYKLL